MPQAPTETTKPKASTAEAATTAEAKTRYTIINAKSRTQFIQQKYDDLDEAKGRLKALIEKFEKQYKLAVVIVDEQGRYQDLPAEE